MHVMTIATTPSTSLSLDGTPKDETITTWSGLLAADRPTVTRTELAKLLRIDTRTVSRAIEDGDISAVRFGRQWFISRQAIIAMFGGGE